MVDDSTLNLPQHIAIILDGNGRWAKAKGMPRSYGHVVGADNLEKVCNLICEIGVKYLTVYAFSTENWKRSENEVKILMNLFRRYLKRVEKSAIRNQMRVKIIGKTNELPSDLKALIDHVEDMSKDFDHMFLQIALNYGGRDEIIRAAGKLAADIKNGIVAEDQVTEDLFSSYLDTAGIPDPDLMIRTSGELRLSNYLPWQLAYSELYFTETPWPAFHKEDLMKAIEVYNTRNRRFGNA